METRDFANEIVEFVNLRFETRIGNLSYYDTDKTKPYFAIALRSRNPLDLLNAAKLFFGQNATGYGKRKVIWRSPPVIFNDDALLLGDLGLCLYARLRFDDDFPVNTIVNFLTKVEMLKPECAIASLLDTSSPDKSLEFQ